MKFLIIQFFHPINVMFQASLLKVYGWLCNDGNCRVRIPIAIAENEVNAVPSISWSICVINTPTPCRMPAHRGRFLLLTEVLQFVLPACSFLLCTPRLAHCRIQRDMHYGSNLISTVSPDINWISADAWHVYIEARSTISSIPCYSFAWWSNEGLHHIIIVYFSLLLEDGRIFVKWISGTIWLPTGVPFFTRL
jgi:hypothetical protein